MKIKQIKVRSDNYAYIIYSNNKNAVVVDPSDANPVLEFIELKNLVPLYLVNTHNHYDHTSGNSKFLSEFNCEHIFFNETYSSDLKDNFASFNSLKIENTLIDFFHTPGHTQDSICIYFDKNLITGDTLFHASCGNTAESDMQKMFDSLINIKSNFSDDTNIWVGHNYTSSGLKFAQMLEPSNGDIKYYINKLSNLDSRQNSTSIKQEKQTNPFFRLDVPNVQNGIIKIANKYNVNFEGNGSDFDYFKILRTVKNY